MNKASFFFLLFTVMSVSAWSQQVLSSQEVSVKSLQYSRDRKYIGWVHLNANEVKVISSDSTWSINIGSSNGGIRAFAFHPNEKKIAIGFYNGVVEFWDFQTATLLWETQAHRQQVNDLKISAGGDFIVSVSNDKTIRCLWSGNGETIKIYNHTCLINAVEFHPIHPAVFVTGDHEGNIIFWKVNRDNSIKKVKAHDSYIHDIIFFQDGKSLLSSSHDTKIKLWNYPDTIPVKTFKGHSRAVYSLDILDLNTFASGAFDKTVCLWNIASENPKQCYEGHSDYINVVRFTNTGDVISGSRDGTIRRWKK